MNSTDNSIKRQAFYNWMDEDIKAEFIDGKIVIHPPSNKAHNDIVKKLVSLVKENK